MSKDREVPAKYLVGGPLVPTFKDHSASYLPLNSLTTRQCAAAETVVVWLIIIIITTTIFIVLSS